MNEELLKDKEAADNELSGQDGGAGGDSNKGTTKKWSRETIYDKINITVRQLDIIIAILIIVLIVALVYGTLKGRRVLR